MSKLKGNIILGRVKVCNFYSLKLINNMYLLCVDSEAKIIMTLWEDYAHQLDDAIEKNHFVRELLVVMLTLAKIKDAKGDCNVNLYFLHFLLQLNISVHFTCNHNTFCKQVSPQYPKYQEWVQVVCEH